METIIYVLELKGGKYYVDRTADIVGCLQYHQAGKGGEWTRKHGECKIVHLEPSTEKFDEDVVTLEYMHKYGVDNVRGGFYQQVELNDYQSKTIQNLLRNGQFAPKEVTSKYASSLKLSLVLLARNGANNEYYDNPTCIKCFRSGHTINACYARTDARGNELCESSIVAHRI